MMANRISLYHCLLTLFFIIIVEGALSMNITNVAEGWIGDGSEGIHTEGNIFTNLQKGRTGSPVNGLWNQGGGITSGSRYWNVQFNLVTDHASVGVSSNSRFGKGWKSKGLFYNGNLSNGGALLVGEFGPRLSSGDVVGMLVSVENGKVSVYFTVNEKPLGLAFEVDSNLFDGALYPAVSLDGSGVVTITEVTPAPQPQPRPKPTDAGITGNWKIDPETIKCETPLPIPPPFRNGALATLKVVEGETLEVQPLIHVYDVLLRVVNNIIFRLKNQEGTSQWETGHQVSTLMMGTPELMAIEQCLSNLTKDPTEVVVTNDDKLQIKKVSLAATWTRYDAAPGPFKGNPFNWSTSH